MAAMLWAVLASALPLAAQESGIDQGLELVRPPGEQPFIRWQTKPGRTYFVQVATQAAPLQEWYFTPFIEVGEGQTIDYEVPASAEIGFFRLKYTDLPLPPGVLPEDADPDGDGLTSEEELLITHTDPLEWDTDGDGLPDGWEYLNGLDPNDNGSDNPDNGADGDPDHDGLLNSEERVKATKPNDADSDHDGNTDGSEINQGTDPNDPTSKPAAEWFVLSGNYPENLTKARSRKITIPKGQCRLVVVMLASDEYPDFTGSSSEYNDILTWNVSGGGLGLSGNLDVNSRNAEWDDAAADGISYFNYPVVHLEEYKSVQAPPAADLQINIALSATNVGDGALPSTVMVGLLPIEFEITHTEIDPKTEEVVEPGPDRLLRDEIVDLCLKVPAVAKIEWTLNLEVDPETMRQGDLGPRSNVKMYDFGQIEDNGSVTPDKTQFGLLESAAGERTIKAVFNKEGKLRISLKSSDSKIDVTSQEFTIEKRIRKYGIPYIAKPSHDPNQYDHEFVDAVDHWGAFYDREIDTVDRVKAMSVAESDVGANVQNPSLRPFDILTVGHPDDGVLARIKGETDQWDLDLVHPKKPAADARYKKLNYTQAGIASTAEAIKWGVLWLYVKDFSLPVNIEANPDFTYEKRNQNPFDVIDGIEEPEYRFKNWSTWEFATEKYNGGGVSNYMTRVDKALYQGLTGTPLQVTTNSGPYGPTNQPARETTHSRSYPLSCVLRRHKWADS
jgi:hypothetical protein